MGDPLSDCSPLISAASLGKLRLVRLLVEGGAQVDGRNPRGETALLAACKALRGEPAGPETLKLLTYLLQNKADPNAQDRSGRTPLMYACMERAGAQVASTLLVAGADPSMEDYSGASALVYAINAQHQPTLKVLIDACKARGRDIIIIATEMGVNGSPVTRRYLNVPPSPDTSPVSCMSPSDIVLKTGSPSSPEGDNIFNFRGTSKKGSSSISSIGSISSRLSTSELSPLSGCSTPPPPRQRLLSEPWLAVHNLASLNQAYEDGTKDSEAGDGENEEMLSHQSRIEEGEGSVSQRRGGRYGAEGYITWPECCLPRVSQSVLCLTEITSTQGTSRRSLIGGSMLDEATRQGSLDILPVSLSPNSELRRNTLPSVMVVPPPLHLPPLVSQSQSHLQVPAMVTPSKSRSLVFLPHPPKSSPPSKASVRPGLLPPLLLASSVPSLLVSSVTSSCCSERSKRSLRRHSVQLEQVRGQGETF